MDRGTRIQKIRGWLKTKDWPDEIRKKTEGLLVRRIKAGTLTSTNSVIYDKIKCEITNVPCIKLVYEIDISGEESKIPIDVLFRQDERKTKRSKA